MIMSAAAAVVVLMTVVMSASAPIMVMMVLMVVLVFMVIMSAAALVLLLASALLLAAAAVVVDVHRAVVVVDRDGFLMLMVVLMTVVMSAAALPMLMMMVMAVAVLHLVKFVQQPAVVHSIDHLVVQLMLVHVQDCAHECEIDLVLGSELSVLLHSVAEVREVEGDSRSVIQCDRALDVAQHHAGLGFNPFPNFKHGLGEPCLGIRVPASDPSRDSGGHSVGLFQRCLLSAHCIIS